MVCKGNDFHKGSMFVLSKILVTDVTIRSKNTQGQDNG